MAIAYEGNTDLAFDTGVLKKAAREYQKTSDELRQMAEELDRLLAQLKESGWTTPAGTAFYEMTQANWRKNIEKYAALLETLNDILIKASEEYEGLVTDYIRTTKLNDI